MSFLTSWGLPIKAALFSALIGSVAYASFDYGVTKTENAATKREQALFDKIEKKQNEAFDLAVTLAKQNPVIQTKFKTIEKKVIQYVEKHSDKRCVVDDADWLRIRAEAVREHNRAIRVQRPASRTDDTARTVDGGAYTSDGQVLAEDVSNIKTCTENAKRLKDLQAWINININH
ncbi:hypothetical protein G6Z94_11735 [Vibrio aestuarianus]|uniref:hypothetical protein n=1 Tax=Vibrio aestuarianus TaxID=28171 RepID=UPI001593A0CD|nr:hypothetical protein [Vibrio aestuarianus]NGZ18010.1 hypothetical protein [Vibrio aestuarianus]